MHLPGKDKLRASVQYNARTGDELLIVLDRKLIAATPSYDIHRGGMGGEKMVGSRRSLLP
jgi:hypothetical protein